jgi:hypothetical protein
MKLREWASDTDAGMESVIFDNDHPILDAEVYGQCETCGGTRVTPKPYGDERDKGRTFSACPDCGKVSVVTQELRERAVLELGKVFSARLGGLMSPEKFAEHHHEAFLMEVDAVLSTVLGDVRTATEMLTVRNGNEIEMNEAVDGTPMLGVQTGTNSAYWPCPVTIAILEVG